MEFPHDGGVALAFKALAVGSPALNHQSPRYLLIPRGSMHDNYSQLGDSSDAQFEARCAMYSSIYTSGLVCDLRQRHSALLARLTRRHAVPG